MSAHPCTVSWERQGAAFVDRRFSRAHTWRFDGGAVVPASASPNVVPAPYSDAAGVDPEEAFVAALASCHMLSFLWLAAGKGLVVEEYTDEAAGHMGKTPAGRVAVTRVVLRPRVTFAAGHAPDRAALEALHHEAHEICFIANSVTTHVEIDPA